MTKNVEDGLIKTQEMLEQKTRELNNALSSLKWTRDKLIEAQQELRLVKTLVLKLTEGIE